MAIIRVNPNTLKQSSGSVTQVGSGVKKLGDEVWRSASSAPSYQGQFGPKVRAIGQAARSNAQKHTSRMNQLSGSLSSRSSAFLAADSDGVTKLRLATYNRIFSDSSYLRFLSSLMGINVIQILLLIRLGKILIPFNRFPWGFIPILKPDPRLPIPLVPPQKPDDRIPKPNPGSKPKNSASGIATKVPANGEDNSYPRLGFDKDGNPKSNCTWYAAEAVATYSDGKITVPNWRSADQWISNANQYLKDNPNGVIAGIDHSPEPGDVMQLNCGHVAFVENAQKSADGTKWTITWSEENATGKVEWPNAEQIKIDGDPILRWRISREFPVDPNNPNAIFDEKYNAQFIHFDY